MKKILLGISCAFLLGFSASAQVMSHSGIKNTVWTGFGNPFYGDFVYHGVIDTIQARVDVGQFTLEGMINWGAIANEFTFIALLYPALEFVSPLLTLS